MEEDIIKDIDIYFSDMTMMDSDCQKNIIEKLMKESGAINEWMIEGEIGLSNGQEESFAIIQLWNNGEAILQDFSSEFIEYTVPVDLIFLKEYFCERGWEFLINEDLVESEPEYWDSFFSIINIDNEDTIDNMEENKGYDKYNNNDSDDEEDYYYDDENSFLDYSEQLKDYKRPTANRYNILNLREFSNHKYDFEKRNENEKINKF